MLPRPAPQRCRFRSVPDRATACQWAGNPVGARGLAALLPAAAAAAAGVEPAGPRANPCRLEDAEEEGG